LRWSGAAARLEPLRTLEQLLSARPGHRQWFCSTSRLAGQDLDRRWDGIRYAGVKQGLRERALRRRADRGACYARRARRLRIEGWPLAGIDHATVVDRCLYGQTDIPQASGPTGGPRRVAGGKPPPA